MEFLDKVRRIGLGRAVDDQSGNFFAYLRYRICRMADKPYFGSYLAATQGKVRRHYYMQELVKNYCAGKSEAITILEIGSWAGGSAITWGEAIKRYSAGSGILYCLDPWTSYLISSGDDQRSWIHRAMGKALQKNRIVELFHHNIRSAGLEDLVFPLRAYSNRLLPCFKELQFDIIFIDANHQFDAVDQDISLAAPLLKEGGILCGDDLELQIGEESFQSHYRFKDADTTEDPVSGLRYHPGVSLAVWKHFRQQVQTWEGLWAMQKTATGWTRPGFDIDATGCVVPEHLG